MLKHGEQRDGIERLGGGKVIGEIAAHELHAGHVGRLGQTRVDSHAVPAKLPQQFTVAAADIEQPVRLGQVRQRLPNTPVSEDSIEPLHPSPPLRFSPRTLRKKLPNTT